MRRLAALLATASAALALAAGDASAATLSASQAYRVANSYGQAYHRAWRVGWQDACDRTTPWRFGCWVEVWTADGTTDCTRSFDVVSPFWGSRLRIENATDWLC